MYDRKSTNVYPALGGTHLHASARICTANTQQHTRACINSSASYTHLDTQTQAEGHTRSNVYSLTLGN